MPIIHLIQKLNLARDFVKRKDFMNQFVSILGRILVGNCRLAGELKFEYFSFWKLFH